MGDASHRPMNDWPSNLPWLAGFLDWFASNRRTVLLAGAGLQLLVLAAIAVTPLTTLITGDTILLRTAPVDPRDLFRGDYVILSYEISRPWRTEGAAAALNWHRLSEEMHGQTVYVLLEPEEDGKHWRSTGYQLEQPTEGKFIRGEVAGNGLVEYGIESYFLQEGTGYDYEQAVREQKLSAEVALDADGNAQLKRLVME